MQSDIIHQLEASLCQTLLQKVSVERLSPCAGGDINQNYRADVITESGPQSYFVKLNSLDNREVLRAEKQNLLGIHEAAPDLRIPKVISDGEINDTYFIVLECLELKSVLSREDQGLLGKSLATMHLTQQTDYGWHADNFIGTNLQINPIHSNWCKFWLEARLEPQWRAARSAIQAAELSTIEKKLFKSCEAILSAHSPIASLCHGDLWAGNAGVTKDGIAVLYDPACYFGDAETDIAMTKLFGGFSSDFYESYTENYPLASSCAYRTALYQLYHLLNHLNLFGSGYLGSVLKACDKICSY